MSMNAKHIGIAALAFAAGVAIALRLRPATDSACCDRVRSAVRSEVGAKCGPLGGLCTAGGDILGLFDRAPSLLDALGVK